MYVALESEAALSPNGLKCRLLLLVKTLLYIWWFPFLSLALEYIKEQRVNVEENLIVWHECSDKLQDYINSEALRTGKI